MDRRTFTTHDGPGPNPSNIDPKPTRKTVCGVQVPCYGLGFIMIPVSRVYIAVRTLYTTSVKRNRRELSHFTESSRKTLQEFSKFRARLKFRKVLREFSPVPLTASRAVDALEALRERYQCYQKHRRELCKGAALRTRRKERISFHNMAP